MHMCVRRSCPHDERPGRLVSGWQPAGLRIKRPHDHPMGPDGHRRARLVIRIGIAPLRCAREHVRDTRHRVGWFRLVRLEVREPLQRSRVRAHGRFADYLWVSRHTGESVVALTQDGHFALGIRVHDACTLDHLGGGPPTAPGRSSLACFLPPSLQNGDQSSGPELRLPDSPPLPVERPPKASTKRKAFSRNSYPLLEVRKSARF